MGRVIILEGPDGSGKTSLAKFLGTYGYEYKHEGPPPQDTDLIDHYHEILQESLDGPSNVVHDRLWLGERIYGPLARGVDRIGPMGQRLFTRLIRSKTILQYVCLPPFEVAKDNYRRKMVEADDFLKNMFHWERTYTEYLSWAAMHGDSNTIFNYKFDIPHRILSEISSPILVRRSLPHGTIGYFQAKHLFIGDKSNHDYLDNPFFNTTGSSGYFNKALMLAEIAENDLAISNAYLRNGEPNELGPILGSLPNLENIFLLGNPAAEWFHKQTDGNYLNLPFKTFKLPHPSYLKRFKGADPAILAALIGEQLG